MKIPSLLLWGMACIALMSCKKNDANTSSAKKIYLAGTVDDANGVNTARYWIDSTSKQVGPSGAYVLDMAVTEKNVYVLTLEGRTTGDFYTIYKNGTQLYEFRQDTTVISKIAVSGNDIYIAGSRYQNSLPYYCASVWKNGVLHFRDNSILETLASGIALNGSAVIVCGREANISSGVVAGRYWVNGTATTVPDSYELYSVTASGSDVYTAGVIPGTNQPAYWKNTSKTQLQSAGQVGYASGIQVVGSDVYVSGYEFVSSRYQPRLWKNGQYQSLENTYNLGGVAYGLFIDGSDVYVAGYVRHAQGAGNQVAVFWKNGTMKLLGNVSTWSEANAISVQ
jgi:hypothetical protein